MRPILTAHEEKDRKEVLFLIITKVPCKVIELNQFQFLSRAVDF